MRAFTDFTKMDSIALADAAVRGLLERTALPGDQVQAIVWGGVILPSAAPNIAREIALDLKLDPGCEGHTVTRACASGLQAVTTAAAAIERGEYDVMIAGGSCRRSWCTPGRRSCSASPSSRTICRRPRSWRRSPTSCRAGRASPNAPPAR
ncbi:Putative acetyl-CoA C-acyltransferase (thiolase) [Mycobacteroides abscessus subsp. abscessus]|nr:Putative acetyl-CoA C-acyltransferase (thiolase) [Mycobacteroides abscessus subsp. abscessus]